MTKTPEQMAEEYVDDLYRDSDYPDQILRHTKKATANVFLAGYKAGQEITNQEIADIIVDIREREEKERNKRYFLQQERNDNIWEKIKLKLVGIV